MFQVRKSRSCGTSAIFFQCCFMIETQVMELRFSNGGGGGLWGGGGGGGGFGEGVFNEKIIEWGERLHALLSHSGKPCEIRSTAED